MAVTDQQKLDFLLKKIGFTKTKTGSVVGTGAISGTGKQPFAEAIPSPLVVPNSSLWNEAASIPATAPGSDTNQVKVYLAGTSGLRMTADSTSSGQRAYIAYTTYNDASSARLTNWIDTQFGASYLIKVYKGDPNSGGVALSAAGSGSNDGWFFDYSAGVLNFNDTSVPSGVTDTNIYIVGYRYIGQTGAPTSGISTFSYIDLTVERNLDVGVQGGISTFRNNIDANGIIEGIAGENKIPFLYSNLAALPNAGTYHGMFAHVHSEGRGYFAHAGNWLELVNKDTSGNVGLSGDLDVDGHTNLDNVSIAGVTTTAGLLDINAGGQANTFKVEDLTDNRIVIAGTGGELEDSANLTFNGTTLGVTGDATFSGNVSIGGTLTYEDVINVDSVGIITAQAGINVTGGVITALAGENKIPSLYANMGALPSAGSYHGMFAHVHATARGYFAHAGNWLELVNKETNGVVGTGTETYNIGNLVSVSSTATSFNVTGVTTVVTLDVNGDIDVDGHTNLDNVNVAGVSTFASAIDLNADLDVDGHTNLDNVNIAGVVTATTFVGNGDFVELDVDGHTNLDNVSIAGVTTTSGLLDINAGGQANTFKVEDLTATRVVYAGTGGELQDNANLTFDGSNLFVSGINVTSAGTTSTFGADIVTRNLKSTGITTAVTVDINGDLDVDGHTNLDNVSIAGVTTFAGTVNTASIVSTGIDLNGDIDVDGHTNLDNVSISGVVTATTFVGNGDFVELDVDGHTNLDNVSIAGVTTFASTAEFDGTAKFDSTITAGGGTGTNGQYLKSTGSGVAWDTFPSLRTRSTFTASSGQTTFSFNYTVNFLDVFVNGIKLTDAEFTATNGSSVVLSVGCFVGDIVELVGYNTVSAGGGAILGSIVEDTSPQLGGNLDLFNKNITGTGNISITGSVTATNLIGDGSGLTNIVGSGSGVVIKNSGSTVGTAGTINFGDNLSVSPASAGIVTITASSSGVSTSQFDVNKLDVSGISTFKGAVDINADIDVDGHTNLDNVSISGVVTATTFVGAVTGNVTGNATGLSGNPTISITDLDVDGHTNLDNVNVAGVTTFASAVVASDIQSNALSLKNAAGSATYATFANGGASVLKFNNTDRLATTNAGVTVTGTVSATAFSGDGSALTGISAGSTSEVRANTLVVTGVSTFSDTVTITKAASPLKVNTLTTNAAIEIQRSGSTKAYLTPESGEFRIQTYSSEDIALQTNTGGGTAGDITFKSVDTEIFKVKGTGNVGIHSTVPTSRLDVVGDAKVSGVVTATSFIGDGSGLTGITASGSGVVIKNSGSTVGTAGTINFGDNLSVSAISGGSVTITGSAGVSTSQFDVNKLDVSGISTFSGNIDVNADLDVDGHTNLDNVSIAGVVTATTFKSSSVDIDGGSIDNTNIGFSVRAHGLFNNVEASGYVRSTGHIKVADHIEHDGDSNTMMKFPSNDNISFETAGSERLRISSSGQIGLGGANYGSSGQVLTSAGSGSAVTWTTISSSPDVGITTNLSGTFTASAGSPSTINTFTGYSANDLVVEYTIYIKNGSDFQSQKLLAMRDGTTIHSTQFAVMFSSSLLVQCDATISSGNILLRATPETGVSGSTTYKIKREVM